MSTVKWTLAFGAGSALLAAAVLHHIHSREGALDVHADQKIDVQPAGVVDTAASAPQRPVEPTAFQRHGAAKR